MKKSMFNSNETALFDFVNKSCETIENDLLATYASHIRNMDSYLRDVKNLHDRLFEDEGDDMITLSNSLSNHKSALAAIRFSIEECDRRAKDAEEIYSKIIGISSFDFAMFGVHITEDAKNVAKHRIFSTIAKINTISSRLMLKEYEIKNNISETKSRIEKLESRKNKQ